MKVNIKIDVKLLEQALEISDIKNTREIVEEALRRYLMYLKRKQMLSLRGNVTWNGNLKQMRSF